MEPPSIVQDFATLFSSWKKKSQSHSFLEFKEIWKENEFSMIFAASVDGFCTDEEWMNVLYSCTYAYLLVDDPRIQLASLYCLYLLYGTQPYTIKQPVITSIYLWKELDKLLKTQKIPGISDGIAIFNTLINQEAWTFSLNIDILPPPHLWASHSSKSQSRNSGNNNRPNLNHILSRITQVDQEYEDAASAVHLETKTNMDFQKSFHNHNSIIVENNNNNNINNINNININNINININNNNNNNNNNGIIFQL
jgi:hypothetical protein